MLSLFIYFFCFIHTSLVIYFSQRTAVIGRDKFLFDCIFFTYAFFPLIFITVNRYGVGTDFFAYQSIFEDNGMTTWKEFFSSKHNIEPLYVIISKIAFILGDGNYKVLLFFNCMLIFSFLYKAIDLFYLKYKFNKGLSVFIYLCFFYAISLNIQRQMIAVSIVLLTYYYLLENKKLTFLFWSIVAIGFHYSALVSLVIGLIVFLVYPLNKKLTKLVIVSTCAFIPLIFKIINILPFFFNYIYKYGIEKSHISIYNILEFIIFLFPLVLFYKKLINRNRNLDILVTISLTAAPIIVMASYQYFFGRLIIYIFILQVVLHPIVISVEKSKYKQIFLTIFFVTYYFSYFILKFYIIGTQSIFPYVLD